ncbi:MAG: 1-deoxy-D-xylulose-5-phosphate reductoisomerase [Firmicutes bacterium]|nr:1-deoxy-D-xylulose-5-phosphate reductoisomerase [Bacillota bacterium]
MKKRIVILGSTGSIGRQALEVVSSFPEAFQVVGLAAKRNIDLLEQQVRLFNVPYAAVMDPDAARVFSERLRDLKVTCLKGPEGFTRLAGLPESDLILVAVTGIAGLRPTLEAIYTRKNIALANKETLVAGGNLVMEAARKMGVQIIPVDSEHSAIFQCWERTGEAARVIITGSGGPFRGFSRQELKKVTPEMALRHPTWQMGPKITVDSATLMNKGLEVIEAKWLFGIAYDQIEVVIHPQSIVHGLVVFKDGSVLAQLSWPDMRLPIQYALFFPERRKSGIAPLDLVKAGQLTFEPPDLDTFPCLKLALEAGKIGGTMPAVLNAANEVAVEAFLGGKISFLAIPELISEAMNSHLPRPAPELEEILAADEWGRKHTERLIEMRN